VIHVLSPLSLLLVVHVSHRELYLASSPVSTIETHPATFIGHPTEPKPVVRRVSHSDRLEAAIAYSKSNSFSGVSPFSHLRAHVYCLCATHCRPRWWHSSGGRFCNSQSSNARLLSLLERGTGQVRRSGNCDDVAQLLRRPLRPRPDSGYSTC
jgi:hypothetical protein